MSFGVGFLGGLADQANRDYADNSKQAQAELDQMNSWFSNQIMPAYQKQQKDAAGVTDRFNRYAAIQGVSSDVAKRAAVDTGHDYSDMDLLNMSKGSQPAQPQGQAQGQGQTPDQSGLTDKPGGITPSNLPGGTTVPTPPPPAIPGQASAAQAQASGQPAPAQPVAPGQAMPVGQQPQQAPNATAPQGMAQQAPVQPPQANAAPMAQGQQQQPDSKGIMNQIGDLLMGRTGNTQVRNQFLQQAAQKYGLQPQQIMELVNHVNNPQPSAMQAAPGSIQATPTIQQGLDVAKQFANGDAANSALHGDIGGAIKAENAQDDSDYEAVRQDNLADAKSLIQAKSAADAAKAGANGGSYDPDTLHNMASLSLLSGRDPNFGMAGGKDRAAFQNTKTAVMKENGWSPNDVLAMQAAVKSGQAGLNQLEKTRDTTETFAQTATLGANQALTLIGDGDAGPTNVALINKWVQNGRVAKPGDDDEAKQITALNNYIHTFASEYGRIMTGAYGASGSTDAATARGDALVNSLSSGPMMATQLKAAMQEINNRRYSQNAAVDTVRQYIGSGGRDNGFAQPFDATIPKNNPLSDQNPQSPGYGVTGPGRPGAGNTVMPSDTHTVIQNGWQYTLDKNGSQVGAPQKVAQ